VIFFVNKCLESPDSLFSLTKGEFGSHGLILFAGDSLRQVQSIPHDKKTMFTTSNLLRYFAASPHPLRKPMYILLCELHRMSLESLLAGQAAEVIFLSFVCNLELG